ncbi:hypothetical protein [Bounagaea algeriensis]
MGKFEVSPDDIRKSGADISDAVSGIPQDAMHGLQEEVDYGHDDVQKAVSDLFEGTRSAVDILRSTAEEATRALRQIAKEYEGSDLKYRKEIGTISGEITKGGLQ